MVKAERIEPPPRCAGRWWLQRGVAAVLRSTATEAFVAMKVAAFRERQEPRDLFDLAHLAQCGAVTSHALDLVAWLTSVPCKPDEFRALPRHTADTWYARLAHQAGELSAAEEALHVLREAVEGVYR
jgi:predicted nucleotidyltransferase component of viral defense system